MNNVALKRVARATMAGVSDAEIVRDPAKYFRIALATVQAAQAASAAPERTP